MSNPIETQVPHDLNAGGEVGKELPTVSQRRLEEICNTYTAPHKPDQEKLALAQEVLTQRKGTMPALGLRAALHRAETFAAEFEFDSDEGCHAPSDLERTLMLDMLNGLFDDEQFVTALSRRSSDEAGVRVKSLEWDGRGATRPWPAWYFLNEAKGLGWRYHYGSDAPYLPTKADAKAAAQSDFDQRILSTLSPSPSIRAEPDFYAVWSGTMHIGTWSEKDHAKQAVREIEGATIVPLFASPQSPSGGEAESTIREFGENLAAAQTATEPEFAEALSKNRSALYVSLSTSPAPQQQEVSEAMVERAAKAIAENHWSVDSDFIKAVHVANTWQYHADDARDALIAALSTGGKA